MDFLQRIDFEHHDGVNLAMINDFMRNQFYDRVLSRYVANQHCTDIGFGTGLLSMLALKHGARHVRAFESDADRYLLGCEIIARLQLQNKIELVHDRYSAATHTATPITFAEIVNCNIWGEGLWHSLPSKPGQVFLPGQYFLEVWTVAIPHSFAMALCRHGHVQRYFSPGVDLDCEFVQTINQFIKGPQIPESQALVPGVVRRLRKRLTDWGWMPVVQAVQTGECAAQYVAQYTTDQEEFVLHIDTTTYNEKIMLIVPRMGMQQDRDRLYLDTGHWGIGEDPVLLIHPQDTLVVRHNVTTGKIIYDIGTTK